MSCVQISKDTRLLWCSCHIAANGLAMLKAGFSLLVAVGMLTFFSSSLVSINSVGFTFLKGLQLVTKSPCSSIYE